MDTSTILILSGFLLFIMVTLAAVRYTSAGLIAADSGKTTSRAKTWRKQSNLEEAQRWLRFLVVVATGLAPLQAICMALHLLKIIPYQNSISVLAPTLGGILTIALARWRSFQELGLDGRKARSALLAALLVVNGANLAVYSDLAVTLLALSAFIALFWVLGLWAGDRLIGSTSLVVVIWFAVYLNGILYSLLPPVSENMIFVHYLLNTVFGVLAVMLPALLFHTILTIKENPIAFSLHLVAGLVLLSIAIYISYQGAATTSLQHYLAAAEYYPFIQLMTATVCGSLLAACLEKRQRLYGPAFALVVSLLLILASSLGWIDTALAAIQKLV